MRRRGAHRRRAHRPHPGRSPLQRGHAPGHRGQGGRGDQEENQTLATITLQNYFRLYDKLVRDDRHGHDRGRRVQPDLQARRGHASRPTGRWSARTSRTSSTRPRRPSSTPSSRTSSSGTRRASRCWSAPSASRSPSTCPSCCSKRRRPARGAQRQAARAGGAIVAQAGRKGAVTVATNMAGRGTDIMLGGNAEFIADRELRAARAGPGRDARGVRGRPGPRCCPRRRGRRRRARRGHRAGRAVRAGHRAARVAPDRQPAARPLRPPGRPGRDAVLPVARATT